MWLLESDGDLYQGKKLWLRPGTTWLLGRTKSETGPNERCNVINHKSVSRKHLTISVAGVKPGQGHEVYTRSTVTLTDDSKLGTIVDGEKIVKTSKTLTKKEHSIKLGSYEQTHKITWHPMVLTFNYSEKEVRRSPDILGPYRAKLEPLDIKTINSYILDATTHVITNKRNIPKGLRALINGKYLVTEDFIEAIVSSAGSPGTDEHGSRIASLLELDFGANWPDASLHLPGPGKEPHPRPAKDFTPKPERINVFENYTFIFCYDSQFEPLSPVLTDGGSKTVKYDLKVGQTRLEDFLRFVRDVAEKKGLDDVYDSDVAKAVVVVRPPGGEEKMDQWTRDFFMNVDLALEQRSVWQNEFLDAILQCDAKPLKRPIAMEESEHSRPPPSTAPEPQPQARQASPPRATPQVERSQSMAESEPAMSQDTPSARPRGKIRRVVAKTRFKKFDDSDDDDEPIMPAKQNNPVIREDAEEDEEEATNAHQATRQADLQSLFVTDSQSQPPSQVPNAANPRKRPHPSTEEDVESGAAMMENLLPGAAAMKRRRLEEAAAATNQPSPTPARDTASETIAPAEATTSKRSGGKKSKQDTELLQAARANAQRLDAQRKGSRQPASRKVSMAPGAEDDEDPGPVLSAEEVRALIDVEYMDIPVRTRNPRDGQANGRTNGTMNGIHTGENNDRWDARWNGLKNFKKFRRKGQSSHDAGNRARSIRVPLEEVKRSDFGLGPQYWLESSSTQQFGRAKSRKGTQSQSQGPSQQVRLGVRETAREATREEEQDAMLYDVEPEEVAGQPRESRMADAVREAADARDGEGATQQQGNARKRPPATRTAAKEPPAKRARQGRVMVGRVEQDDESSEEDAAKFRFSRKR